MHIKKTHTLTQQLLEQRHKHDCICLRLDLTENSKQMQFHTDTHLQPYLIRAALLVLSLPQLAHDWTRLGQNTWSENAFLPSLLSLSSSCPSLHPSTTASLPPLLSANPLSVQPSVAPDTWSQFCSRGLLSFCGSVHAISGCKKTFRLLKSTGSDAGIDCFSLKHCCRLVYNARHSFNLTKGRILLGFIPLELPQLLVKG